MPYLLYVRMLFIIALCPGRDLVLDPIASPSLRHTPCAFLGQAEKAAAEKRGFDVGPTGVGASVAGFGGSVGNDGVGISTPFGGIKFKFW